MAENRVEIQLALGLQGLQSGISKAEQQLSGIQLELPLGIDPKQTEQLSRSLGDVFKNVGLDKVAAEAAVLKQRNKDAADAAALLKKEYDLSDGEAKSLAQSLLQVDKATESAAQEAATLGRSFDSVVTGISQGIGQNISNTAINAVTGSFRGLAGAITGSLDTYRSFEGAIKSTGVVSGSEAESLAALRDEVQRLGLATSKAPGDIAAMTTELARSGFTAEEQVAALEGVVRASEATGENLSAVGDIIGKTIRTFSLSADESGRVADVLVATANSTNTSVASLGESLSYVGPAASAANQPLEDVLVLLGLLGDQGIQGSMAGTNLAAALERLKIASAGGQSEFTNLVRGSAKATEAFNAIGTEVRNTDGTMKSLLDVLPAIQGNIDGLSQADKDILFKALFGVEGGRAFQALMNTSADRINLVSGAVENSAGIAEESGEKMLAGYGGALKLIDGTQQTLAANVGAIFAPAAETAVRAVNSLLVPVAGLVGEASKLPPPVELAVSALLGLTAAAVGGVIALTAYQLVINSSAGALLAKSIAETKATIATTAHNTATALAANTQALFAVATGKATAAQAAQVGVLTKTATTAGLAAGAIASVSLAVAVYRDVTASTRAAEVATEDLRAAMDALREAQLAAADTETERAAAAEESAAANLKAVEEGIAGYNKVLDVIRNVVIAVQDFGFGILLDPLIERLQAIPGIGQKVANALQGIRDGITFDTAAEAAANNADLAFDKVVESTFEAQDAALELAGKLSKGIEVDPAVVDATVSAVEESIAALEAQKPVTEADIALRDGQIAQLQKLQATLTGTTGATDELAAATTGVSDAAAEQISAVDQVSERIQGAADESALALAQSNERIQSELAAGLISQEEATAQAAAAEKQALQERILVTEDAIAQIKAAQVSAADPEEQAALNDQLKDLELDLAESRADLAKTGAEERIAADEAAADARVAAEEAAAEKVEEILSSLSDRSDEKIASVTNAAKAEEAALLSLQLSGAKSASEVQAQLSQITAEGTQERLAIRAQELAELNAKVDQGVISEEDAAKRVAELTTEVGDLRIASINEAIAAQQALEQAELERISKVVSAQEQQAQLAQQEATIQIKQEVASNPAVADAEQTEARLAAIAQQGVEDRLRIKLAEFDAVREAQAQGLISAETANARLTELQFEINGLREESADAQIAAAERVKAAQIEAIQQAIDLQKQLGDAVQERIAIEAQQLDTQGRQAQAALGAEQAVAALETEKLKTKLAQAEASENETKAAQLKEQIFKSTLEQQKLELEGKQRALELEAQQLALKQQSAQVSAQIAVLEAQASLSIAQAEGGSEAQLAALQDVIGLRERQLTLTEDQAKAEAQILADQQRRLNTEADIAAEQAKQQAFSQDLGAGARSQASGLASVSGDAAAVYNNALADSPNLDQELRSVQSGAVAQAGQPQPAQQQQVTNQNGGNTFNFQTADPVADAAALTNAMNRDQARAMASPGGGCGGGGCC